MRTLRKKIYMTERKSKIKEKTCKGRKMTRKLCWHDNEYDLTRRRAQQCKRGKNMRRVCMCFLFLSWVRCAAATYGSSRRGPMKRSLCTIFRKLNFTLSRWVSLRVRWRATMPGLCFRFGGDGCHLIRLLSLVNHNNNKNISCKLSASSGKLSSQLCCY